MRRQALVSRVDGHLEIEAVDLLSVVVVAWKAAKPSVGALAQGIRESGAWIAVLVIGAVLVAVRDPAKPQLALDILGQLSIAFGSAGVGAKIGRARADSLTRARLLPLFKQGNRAGEGLVRLQNEVTFARTNLLLRGTPSVPTKDAEAHLRAIAIRIDEQGADRVGTLEDWRVLLPEDVENFEQGSKELSE